MPGSNLNALQRKTYEDNNVDGDDANYLAVRSADGVFVEVEPTNMNLLEGLIQAASDLESSALDYVVPMGMYLDAPNIADEGTDLPTPLFTNATPFHGNGDTPKSIIIAKSADFLDVHADVTTLDDNGVGGLPAGTSRDSLWIVVTEAQGAKFGENVSGALVRAARIIGWEKFDGQNSGMAAGEFTRLYLDRKLSFSVSAGGVVGALAEGPAYSVYSLSSSDVLMYYSREDVDGEIQHSWYSGIADPNGTAYYEVNFAYELAKFCHDLTENDNFALGIIGVEPPSNHFKPAARSVWLGKLPVYDDLGNVETNGSGILGNKFLAGAKEGGVQFSPGFFATTSGYLGDTSVLLDDNDIKVDMGRYLSIVSTWPIFNNLLAANAVGYASSGASLFAGLQASLRPWSSATNKPLSLGGLRLPVKLAKRHQNSLVGLGFTSFIENTGGDIVPVDSPSASLRTSDFTRNMTTRMVGEVLYRVRGVASAFMGEALTSGRRAGLETGLQKALADLKSDSEGVLEEYQMQLSQTALEKVRGTARLALSLRLLGELRRIFVTVSLSL
jgi:hypothetical protein